jgi:hypothetical protein
VTLTTFRLLLIVLAAGLALAFAVICIPAPIEKPGLLSAAAAGFVNPYSTGDAVDTIFCWGVLAVWMVYEANAKGLRHVSFAARQARIDCSRSLEEKELA